MSNPQVFPTIEALGHSVAHWVAKLSQKAIAARGRFIVALSGGSLPKIIGPALVVEPLRSQIEWSAWHVFWADERCVPQTHPDSNYFVAKEYLFDQIPIPPAQIYNPNTALDPVQTATDYQHTLSYIFSTLRLSSPPSFDLILLGLGEDGHTASLFPGHPLLQETERWVAPIFDSPKPPPERITLTLPALNNAQAVGFITAGAGKADVLAQIFGSPPVALPAQRVNPIKGELHWFVDAAAAARIA
jgi:6-phosphogluconolactonase